MLVEAVEQLLRTAEAKVWFVCAKSCGLGVTKPHTWFALLRCVCGFVVVPPLTHQQVMEPADAESQGFDPLRFLAEYLMRHNPKK